MANPPSERQAALRIVARGARALVEEGALDADTVRALVPSWRAAAIEPGAGADHVDAATLARLATWGAPLLSSSTIVLRAGPPRARPRAVQDGARAVLTGVGPGEALLAALSLSLEAAKRAHKLPARAEDLKASFPSPDAAREALDALSRGGDARELSIEPVELDGHRLRTLLRDRPIVVVAGAGAWRMHDLLSPWARRLGRKLALLGARGERVHEESVYLGARALAEAEPAVDEERLAAEESDGFVSVGPVLVALLEKVPDAGADRRAHEALRQLKKQRAALVFAEHAMVLELVLSAVEARVVAALATGPREVRPERVVDLASGNVAAIENLMAPAEGTITTFEDDRAGETFALVQAALRATARPGIALGCVPPTDDRTLSRMCLEILSRMGGPERRSRR